MGGVTARIRGCSISLLTLGFLLTGCDGVFYVWHVAQGQFGVQGSLEYIDDVLASGRLTEEEQEKLRLVVSARQFAVEQMGLNAGDSYTLFYDTSGDPLAFNLSAAHRDALVPVTWRFPFVGEVPYLAFFDEEYLRQEEQKLVAQGRDVFTYELDAYSTLGVFADPVRSTMLRRGELSLAETIIHELLHNTVYRSNATVFNESLANFVGRQGAVEFLQAQFGADSGWPDTAAAYYADLDVINAFLAGLYLQLESHYAQGIPADQKISGREAVYQAARDRFTADIQPTLNYPDVFVGYAELPSNNAWMLGHRRYNLDLDLLAAVYEATGGDWLEALEVYRSAANARSDPFDHLRDWLAEHTN